ncbi:MAG: type II toxin-antitoxin system Phd/YefM family antitoxin [Acidobacteriota bacterium]
MIRLNIHEAKTHLSRYLENVARGETILLCKRNTPVAEIRPIRVPVSGKRPIGLARGKFRVSKKFLEPLPPEVLNAFNGKR